MKAFGFALTLCLVAVDAKDAIDFNCTATPLAVDYSFVKHYSGKVNCGTLLLESSWMRCWQRDESSPGST